MRRQQLRFDDLVHLVLFQLHVHNRQRRYFDERAVIVPYAIDNWHTMQLPQSVSDFYDMSQSTTPTNHLVFTHRFRSDAQHERLRNP